MAEGSHSAEQTIPRAIFPKATFRNTSCLLQQSLPERPLVVAPVFDQEYSKEPIFTFDATLHRQVYPSADADGIASTPEDPLNPTFSYLFPSLSSNERARLTLLWYHTWNIENDAELLAQIDAVVKSVQESIGWDYAIAGIVNESTFTRLATSNLPLALLPRRESTCSHTINQVPGTVFMVTDMKNDWRFKNSPHVKIGGLTSYAGTQLRLMAEDGNEVALGSLCVAADNVKAPLTSGQQNLLLRSAELISAAIDSHTRQRRYRTRLQLSKFIQQMRSIVGFVGCEGSVLDIIQKAYPEASVLLQSSADGSISLPGRANINSNEIVDGLWEDTKLLDEMIRTSNHSDLVTSRTIRAIVNVCGKTGRYLIVASSDVHLVFDDFDAWFVHTAASIVAEDMQSVALRQALQAKEKFLRGITHQLRTPIHGILSSTELLAEELVTARLLETLAVPGLSAGASSSPAACIAALRSSGRELMTTVNNILRHNTWSEGLRKVVQEPYDLRNLEKDILPGILASLAPESTERLAIEFHLQQTSVKEEQTSVKVIEDAETNLQKDNVKNGEIPPCNELYKDQTATWVLNTDAQLLQDCLSAILLNAIQACSTSASGIVTVTICQQLPHNLHIDIIDNGIGIDEANHTLIFEPYEKVDVHKAGAGLGLTLASQIAQELGMTLQLIRSSLGNGTHFRLNMDQPDFVLDQPSAFNGDELVLKHLPRCYYLHAEGDESNHFCQLTVAYLQKHEFKQSTTFPTSPALILSNLSVAAANAVSSDHPQTILLCYTLSDPQIAQRSAKNPKVLFVTGPLTNLRLRDICIELDNMYGRLCLKEDLKTIEDEPQPVPSRVFPGEKPINDLEALGPPQVSDQRLSLRPKVCAGTKLKALLVDDNLINLRILEMFCTKRRIPYVSAADGKKAIDQYCLAIEKGEPITIVFMDLQMPICNGVEAVKSIRSYEETKQLTSAYILMITGQDSGKDRQESKEAGADVFLVKPVGPNKLDTYIAKASSDYRVEST